MTAYTAIVDADLCVGLIWWVAATIIFPPSFVVVGVRASAVTAKRCAGSPILSQPSAISECYSLFAPIFFQIVAAGRCDLRRTIDGCRTPKTHSLLPLPW